MGAKGAIRSDGPAWEKKATNIKRTNKKVLHACCGKMDAENHIHAQVWIVSSLYRSLIQIQKIQKKLILELARTQRLRRTQKPN